MPSTRTNIFGTNSARSAARRRVHGVVRVRSTTSEIETATRTMMIAGAVQPLRGEPDLVAEPGAEGHDDRPRRDEVERGRQHDDAREDRDEEPDPLDEEHEREPADDAERQHRGVDARARTATLRTSAATTSSPSRVTSLTRGSSCCSSPGCAATSSLKMAWRISDGAALQRLLDEAALPPLADATARAQRRPRAAPASRVSRAGSVAWRSWRGGGGGDAVHVIAGGRAASDEAEHGDDADDGETDEHRADGRRRVVPERRVAAALEVVAREERVAPEVAVLAPARSARRSARTS